MQRLLILTSALLLVLYSAAGTQFLDIKESCESLVLPSNETEPEDGNRLYSIVATAKTNETWSIRIGGRTPFVTFKNFIVQARPVSDPAKYETVGSFKPAIEGNEIETVACLRDDDTAAYTGVSIRAYYDFIWTAPVNSTGTVVFA